MQFFPKDFKIEHTPLYNYDSSLLYTVSRKTDGLNDISNNELPVTLKYDNYMKRIFEKDQEEVIKEESGIIDLRSIHHRKMVEDEELFEFYHYVINKFIVDMISWYGKRMDFLGVRDKPSIAKMLKCQGFYPFLSKKDLLKIDVVVRFYEKKEEVFIKKEERNVLSVTDSLSHRNDYPDCRGLLRYEFEKAWPDKILPSQYIDFCITYSLRLSEDKERPSFKDIC